MANTAVFLGLNAPPKINASEIGAGTHRGKLDFEARQRRAEKNARNRNRQHEEHPLHKHDMIAPGSSKRVNTRLFLRGNRQSRGHSR